MTKLKDEFSYGAMKKMKRQVLLQNAMIIFPASLLVIGFFSRTMTVTSQSVNGPVTQAYALFGKGTMLGTFLGLLVLVICIGAIAFRVTGRKKPLDWVMLGSLCGVVLYWLPPFLYTDMYIRFHVVVFIILISELFLAIGYKIGQKISLFV